jgi:hypothetical protein
LVSALSVRCTASIEADRAGKSFFAQTSWTAVYGSAAGARCRKPYPRRPVEAMDSIALKMLFGDRLEYPGNVCFARRSKTGIIARPPRRIH